MKTFRSIAIEKLVALVAFLALAVAIAWWWHQQSGLRRLRAERVAAALVGTAYVRATLLRLDIPEKLWSQPAAQSSGEEWRYELFTPPLVSYHAATKKFSVAPLPGLAGEAAPQFGVELLGVRREPFRLQLVGFVGAAGDYIGTFVSDDLPQTLLGRAGARFAPLGLTLKTFEVRRVNVAPRATAPVYDVAGFAVLHDEWSGSEVTLDTQTRKFTGAPLAMLRLVAEGGARPRAVREGEAFRHADATYRIERIQLDPPEVVVGKMAVGRSTPEQRVLKPASALDPEATRAATTQTYPAHSETNLAAAEQPHR